MCCYGKVLVNVGTYVIPGYVYVVYWSGLNNKYTSGSYLLLTGNTIRCVTSQNSVHPIYFAAETGNDAVQMVVTLDFFQVIKSF